ncbi:MAG: ATP synthase F1 subunit delta [Acidobacteriota bacterium]|nr:ATP synthase F1 subunit delta [Acidobacteriota bacterium]
MAAVSSRYARALADVIAETKIDPAKALLQLRSLAEAFACSKDLREIWETPAVTGEQKLNVLDALAARTGVTDRAVRNFVAVLIEKGRIAQLPEIAERLEDELNKRAGLVDAEIVSARELPAAQRAALLEEITRLTGKQVLASYATDAALLGGVKVRVGSTIYDGSVRGQLQRIRQQLVES